MPASYGTAFRRWRDRMMDPTARKPLTHPNIIFDGDVVVSRWGIPDGELELGRALRDANGTFTGFLLNGDQMWLTRAFQQSQLRWVVQQAPDSSGKAIIVPYEALASAGVNRATVQPLEVSADRWITENHVETREPLGLREETMTQYVRERRPVEDLRVLVRVHHPWEEREGMTPEQMAHILGHLAYEGKHVQKKVLSLDGAVVEHKLHDDGTETWEWTTRRHLLGESLFRARVEWTGARGARHSRWATFLSGFDANEPRPLYFLSEMPPTFKGTTIAEAYEALKPEPVVLAERMGREVTRQGDIFAIEAPTWTDERLLAAGAVIEERKITHAPRVFRTWDGTTWQRAAEIHAGQLLGTNHTADVVARMPDGTTLARGIIHHDPIGRDADHVDRRLGDAETWHVIVKNTVPVAP